MDVNEYQKSAMTTLNPTLDRKDVLINSVMGLCGESGEAIDIVKKWLMQGHELDKEHLIKELGDVAWYLAEASTALDVPLETVFQENLDKLHRRFPVYLFYRKPPFHRSAYPCPLFSAIFFFSKTKIPSSKNAFFIYDIKKMGL